MATAYLRAESAPVILPHNFAKAAAVMAQFDRAVIASAIEVMVNLLDVFDGDADDETTDPDHELAGDEKDAAWIEWDQMRGSQKPGPCIIPAQDEDDEDDDPAEEDDDAGQCDEDGVNTAIGFTLENHGPGCMISDDDFEHDGQEPGF